MKTTLNKTTINSARYARRSAMVMVVMVMVVLPFSVMAHDYVPGKMPARPILLKGGDLYTVANGTLPQTDLLFENGRIIAIGKNLAYPQNTEIIDVTGKRVYPGLIAPYSRLGLTEIGGVRATNDLTEIGVINPDVQTRTAYNPDSEILPTVRFNGITTALVVPDGQLINGVSCLMNLDGWTAEDATEKPAVGLHIKWPRAAVIEAWWMDKSAEEQKREMAESRQLIYKTFDDARTYYLARKENPRTPMDMRWEAMVPVIEGIMPVFIEAGDYRQIEQAVQFAKDNGLRMILVGGRDAWMRPDLLIDNDIPVIAGGIFALPAQEDDGYDLPFRLPATLSEAGVKFCLAVTGGSGTRNLSFHAGMAVAFGLYREEALRAITLTAAEIFGVADDLGSLEVGKRATLVVSDGDILDPLNHRVIYEYIRGCPVDLNNKHQELYEKYRQK